MLDHEDYRTDADILRMEGCTVPCATVWVYGRAYSRNNQNTQWFRSPMRDRSEYTKHTLVNVHGVVESNCAPPEDGVTIQTLEARIASLSSNLRKLESEAGRHRAVVEGYKEHMSARVSALVDRLRKLEKQIEIGDTTVCALMDRQNVRVEALEAARDEAAKLFAQIFQKIEILEKPRGRLPTDLGVEPEQERRTRYD